MFFPRPRDDQPSPPPQASAYRQWVVVGTGEPMESEVFTLDAPPTDGSVGLVPVGISLAAPLALAVNEDFDERVAEDESEWVADRETPTPLRADGTVALSDLTPLHLGSHAVGEWVAFGPETRSVKLSVLQGGERLRLHALAPEGSGEAGAYVPADWLQVASGQELWGSVYARKDGEGVSLPDWSLWAEGLEPGKAVLQVEVDRYGEILTEQKTLYVTRTELVARDRDTGDVGPVSGGFGGPAPTPHVELRIDSAELIGTGETKELRITVSGLVRDPLSELMTSPLLRVRSLTFEVNGRAVDGLSDLPALAQGNYVALPWTPGEFRVPFTRVLRTTVSGPQVVAVRAITSENAAGGRGWADARVTLSRALPDLTPPPLVNASLRWSTSPSSGAVDRLRVLVGSGVPDPLADELIETAAGSGVFQGMIRVGGEERAAELTLFLGAGSDPAALDGRLVYSNGGGGVQEFFANWERDSGDAALHRVARMLPPEGVRGPLVVSSFTSVGGTSDEGFASAVLRVDGFQEAPGDDLPVSIVAGDYSYYWSEISLLQPFVFGGGSAGGATVSVLGAPGASPLVGESNEESEYLYLVNKGTLKSPTLFIASSPVLYGQEERVDILRAGLNRFTLRVAGQPAVEGTSAYALSPSPRCAPVEHRSAGVLSLQQVLGNYEFLFGHDRDGVEKIGNQTVPMYLHGIFAQANCAYEIVDGDEVEGSFLTNVPARLVIRIGRDANPMSAASGLLQAYSGLMHTKPVYSTLVDGGADTLTLLHMRNQSAIAAIEPIREAGLEAMKVLFTFGNPGGEIALTIDEVVEGESDPIALLPLVPKGVKNVVLRTATGGITRELRVSGATLAGLSQYGDQLRPHLRKSSRFNGRVLGVPGARVRIEFMETVGRHLTREELRKLYEDFDVLKSDKNRKVLAEQMTLKGRPKPGWRYRAHHDLPLEFEKDFLLAGLDPNAAEFGRWVDVKTHRGWHGKDVATGKFNEQWEAFLNESDKPKTAAEIRAHLAKIKRTRYKYDEP